MKEIIWILFCVSAMPLVGNSGEEEAATLKSVKFNEFFSTFQEKQAKEKGILLDIRTPREFLSGHAPGAKNIDYYAEDFAQSLNRLNKEEAYFIYCNSGNRSRKALRIFKSLGFREVYELRGGWMWNKKGLLSFPEAREAKSTSE